MNNVFYFLSNVVLKERELDDSNPGTETENLLADAYQHELFERDITTKNESHTDNYEENDATDVEDDIYEQDIEDAMFDGSKDQPSSTSPKVFLKSRTFIIDLCCGYSHVTWYMAHAN